MSDITGAIQQATENHLLHSVEPSLSRHTDRIELVLAKLEFMLDFGLGYAILLVG